MTIEQFVHRAELASDTMFQLPDRRSRTVASYERELTEQRRTEMRLRVALGREKTLLRQKNELIRQQELLSRSSIIGRRTGCK